MTENWFEIAWINYAEAILHGQKGQSEVRIALTDEQKDKVRDMNERHQAEMQELLGSFA